MLYPSIQITRISRLVELWAQSNSDTFILKRIIQHYIALSELSWRKIVGSFDLIMSQNRGEYSCLFTFKRDKHHLNSRTGQCRQNSIPNLIFRQKFPNFYPKQETKSINDYIQRHSFPFLIMPQSHDGDEMVTWWFRTVATERYEGNIHSIRH